MVYIDNFNAPFRGMIMCHMIADTTEELLQMADKIDLPRKYIQHAGTAQEHFDVCLSKKQKAIKHGAIEISAYELATITASRKGHPLHNQHEVEKAELLKFQKQVKLWEQA